MLDCAAKTFRTEGIRGFYKGLGATFLRLAPHNIILWMVSERVIAHCDANYLGD